MGCWTVFGKQKKVCTKSKFEILDIWIMPESEMSIQVYDARKSVRNFKQPINSINRIVFKYTVPN